MYLVQGLLLFLPVPTGATVPAPGSVPAQEPSAAAEEPARFGPPLVVNGERIADEDIQRFLCFAVGSNQVDFARFQVLIDQEVALRREAGEDVSKYEVGDEELDRAVAQQREDFLLRYPTLDFPTEVARAATSLDLWRESHRQTLLFDKLFLPPNPEDWPALTREVIREFGGDPFLQDAQESYEFRRQRMLEEGLEELPPDDPLYVETLRATVLEAVAKYLNVEEDPANLPPGVLMTVEGVPVPIDAVWRKIEPHVDAVDVRNARRYLALTRLVEDHLKEKDALLTQKEFEDVFAKDGRAYAEELINYQMYALQVLGFPSMQSFVEYQRLIESFRGLLADELAKDEVLRSHLAEVNPITGGGKIDAEVILVSAFDFDEFRWKEDGWKEAERKAHELKERLDEGADWSQMLELHSEFWDPPMPDTGRAPSMLNFRFKGRFGPQTRNQLMGYMNESEHRTLLYGQSITDHMFYDQPVGSIEGPFRGPDGYYITRLVSRTPPNRLLDLSEPVHRQILENHHLKTVLQRTAWELLNEGLKDGSVQGVQGV